MDYSGLTKLVRQDFFFDNMEDKYANLFRLKKGIKIIKDCAEAEYRKMSRSRFEEMVNQNIYCVRIDIPEKEKVYSSQVKRSIFYIIERFIDNESLKDCEIIINVDGEDQLTYNVKLNRMLHLTEMMKRYFNDYYSSRFDELVEQLSKKMDFTEEMRNNISTLVNRYYGLIDSEILEIWKNLYIKPLSCADTIVNTFETAFGMEFFPEKDYSRRWQELKPISEKYSYECNENISTKEELISTIGVRCSRKSKIYTILQNANIKVTPGLANFKVTTELAFNGDYTTGRVSKIVLAAWMVACGFDIEKIESNILEDQVEEGNIMYEVISIIEQDLYEKMLNDLYDCADDEMSSGVENYMLKTIEDNCTFIYAMVSVFKDFSVWKPYVERLKYIADELTEYVYRARNEATVLSLKQLRYVPDTLTNRLLKH